MGVVLLAVVVAYLLASAVIALGTVGQPRRAFDLPLSLALAVTRVCMALAVLAVIVYGAPAS